ncbi:hypothetical protein LAZ67_X003364 [Cordylochernes scorpioides]|uniref:Uncharacterized protein n=1 Tax=Cordylochernes scorpioides TaxID=51811 RepID=A0ABY6LUK2_9ARAC|nr:hypothetical protein LAZ67_X003364 [Cordylochernes scorpioides]
MELRVLTVLHSDAVDLAATNKGTRRRSSTTPPTGSFLGQQWPYKVSPSERRLIENEVNKMIQNHIVKPSGSPWLF